MQGRQTHVNKKFESMGKRPRRRQCAKAAAQHGNLLTFTKQNQEFARLLALQED